MSYEPKPKGYLDFDNEKWQKGYKPFEPSKENVLANVGKKICYLLKKDYDSYRGYMRVKYGVIQSRRYSYVYVGNGNDSFDARDVLECGIEI